VNARVSTSWFAGGGAHGGSRTGLGSWFDPRPRVRLVGLSANAMLLQPPGEPGVGCSGDGSADGFGLLEPHPKVQFMCTLCEPTHLGQPRTPMGLPRLRRSSIGPHVRRSRSRFLSGRAHTNIELIVRAVRYRLCVNVYV